MHNEEMKVLIALRKIRRCYRRWWLNTWTALDMILTWPPTDRKQSILQKAKEGEYDICLMDIDMPVMDGCEATREIRKTIRYFPIMAVSGNERIRNIYQEIGMDDFLMKPYLVDSLYDKINGLTVKAEKMYFQNDELCLKKEMPMDQKELQELIELKKKGLTKLKLVGLNHTFVVHKNIQNKISNDLIGEDRELSEFIDRS